ncbi:Uncharacterised protein [Citrobacter werkmanii]|uniref:Uncharacterized protein n=1 Tax=Citrobacter werkmanii TaxID=67827 RepID=A0A9N8CSS7_9ENTR|nr:MULTISPECIES: hypothetical protein [Citrobacter freundii complex]EGT0636003.1 hypothetical protein [Citrobacter freundii]KWZ91878.1 hypothetical protein HMPREF3212_01323 [Citrobacter freundii]MDK8076148.1 hypothetical protein [Citrobacter freundii]MDK8590409.1 hypothetical protein [Citrobacter freundii]WFY90550.1 hypothetical protein NFK47_12820 [Citrobacter freundii]
MSDSKVIPEITQVATLEKGRTLKFGINKAVEFEIKTAGGTVIKGTIPASEYLVVTNGGDITDFNINLYESKSGPRELD